MKLALRTLATILFLFSTASLAAILEQVSPTPTSYVLGTGASSDFLVFGSTPTGDVTASVSGIDIQLGIGNLSTSGCEAADFAAFSVGHIALIQRGTCMFSVKALNAEAAGASGVLIFNQGNTSDPSRNDPTAGTLGDPFLGTIPVLGLSYSLGANLSSISGLVMHMAITQEDLPAPVPTPATLPLILLGLAGLSLSRRKRASDLVA